MKQLREGPLTVARGYAEHCVTRCLNDLTSQPFNRCVCCQHGHHVPHSPLEQSNARQLGGDLLCLFLSQEVQELTVDFLGMRPAQAVRPALDHRQPAALN